MISCIDQSIVIFSWHSPQNFLSLNLLLFYCSIVRNMASEADSSLLKNTPSSIKSSSTQQVQLRSLVHKFTRPPYENELTYDKKNRKLIYCNQCESYSALLTTNIKRHLKKDHAISVNLKQPRTKEQAFKKL